MITLKRLNFRFIKYTFSALITILSFFTTHSKRFLIICLIELLIIAITSEIVQNRSRKIGAIFNSIFMLLYNIQVMVLYFGNSYVLLVMLTNLSSIRGLSGKGIEYICSAILVIVFSLLPISRRTENKISITTKELSIILAMELVLTLLWGNNYSPLYGTYNLAMDGYKWIKQQNSIGSEENITGEFYKQGVDNYRNKDDNIVERPNVVLILSEGLSQNIVLDPRNVMPNLKKFQENSLNFTGYYNHTFATYRGIIGQLYSGYQGNNLDSNTLVSLQDIFKGYGYETIYINTEPLNTQFTEYIDQLKFDKILGNANSKLSGTSNTMSDKEAYEFLFDVLSNKDTDKPLFVTIYTFGTHTSFDSPDQKFEDGSNRTLNRFYNLDFYFGEFLNKFNNSDMSKNTILVFTADHATFADSDYMGAFPDTYRPNNMLDEIPLSIYYKGIVPEAIEADGRNSLDLAPTILDYLDMSGPNYFLGMSLFAPKQNNNTYDTIFAVENTYLDTDGKNITELSPVKMDIIETQMKKYLTAKTQNPET